MCVLGRHGKGERETDRKVGHARRRPPALSLPPSLAPLGRASPAASGASAMCTDCVPLRRVGVRVCVCGLSARARVKRAGRKGATAGLRQVSEREKKKKTRPPPHSLHFGRPHSKPLSQKNAAHPQGPGLPGHQHRRLAGDPGPAGGGGRGADGSAAGEGRRKGGREGEHATGFGCCLSVRARPPSARLLCAVEEEASA